MLPYALGQVGDAGDGPPRESLQGCNPPVGRPVLGVDDQGAPDTRKTMRLLQRPVLLQHAPPQHYRLTCHQRKVARRAGHWIEAGAAE